MCWGSRSKYEEKETVYEEELRQKRARGEIINSELPAGSDMYYYCKGKCGTLVAIKPELWVDDPPPDFCEDCRPVKIRH